MKVNLKVNYPRIIKLIAAILLLVLAVSYPLSATGERSVPVTPLQNEIMLPQVKVTQILVPENIITEGDIVSLTVIIQNNDNLTYMGISLVVTIQEVKLNFDPHSENEENEPQVVYNQSLPQIPAQSSIQVTVSYKASYGQFSITGLLTFQGRPLPNSDYSTLIEVLNKPVGSEESLYLTLAGVGGLLLVIFLLPSLNDVIQRKKQSKTTRS